MWVPFLMFMQNIGAHPESAMVKQQSEKCQEVCHWELLAPHQLSNLKQTRGSSSESLLTQHVSRSLWKAPLKEKCILV